MTKTLTIELPDDLEQLSIQANVLNEPLEKLILQTLGAIAGLIQNLRDANPQTRQGAAEALGAIGTEIAIPSLSQALRDENLSVRQATVEALRKIGTEAAVSAISRELLSVVQPSNLKGYDPITPLIGTLHLGTTDLAENHDHYIGEALTRQLNSIE